MSYQITKKDLRRLLGLDTDAELARYYGISRSSVSEWGDDDPVPELRVLQAMQRNPEKFSCQPASNGVSAAQRAVG